MAVDMAGRFVKVDDQCRTSMSNVWAIGDLVGEPMLEHKAATQGEMVAEIIAGHNARIRSRLRFPRCASPSRKSSAPGCLPDEAGPGRDHRAMFPFAANGRALAMDAGDDGGFVRVVARKSDHHVLGIQAVGAHVAELSNEFSPRARNGRGAGRHRRHDPRPPDAGRSVP